MAEDADAVIPQQIVRAGNVTIKLLADQEFQVSVNVQTQDVRRDAKVVEHVIVPLLAVVAVQQIVNSLQLLQSQQAQELHQLVEEDAQIVSVLLDVPDAELAHVHQQADAADQQTVLEEQRK